MAPRAKVDKSRESNVAVAEDFDIPDDVPFDLDELELDDLPELETEITEEDLLNAASQMGDEVSLDLAVPEEKSSVNDLALQLLQKEVRDTQVMVAKFGVELEEFKSFIKGALLDMDKEIHKSMDLLSKSIKEDIDRLNNRIVLATPVSDASPEPAEEIQGLTDGQKQKILEWMGRQEKLPSAAVTAQGLGGKLGVPGGVIMAFFREQKLTGKGGSLKKPE